MLDIKPSNHNNKIDNISRIPNICSIFKNKPHSYNFQYTFNYKNRIEDIISI